MPSYQDFLQAMKKRKQEEEQVDWFPRLHDILMKEYGWIPLDDFLGKDVKGEISFDFPVSVRKRFWSKQEIQKVSVKGDITLKREAVKMPMLWSLLKQITKRYEREKEEMEKSKSKSRSRLGR